MKIKEYIMSGKWCNFWLMFILGVIFITFMPVAGIIGACTDVNMDWLFWTGLSLIIIWAGLIGVFTSIASKASKE